MYDIITRLQEYENKKRTEKFQRGKIYKLENYSSTKSIFFWIIFELLFFSTKSESPIADFDILVRSDGVDLSNPSTFRIIESISLIWLDLRFLRISSMCDGLGRFLFNERIASDKKYPAV